IDVSSILAIRYTLAKTYISILHDENFSFLFLINYQVMSHLNLTLRKSVHLFVSLPLQRNAFFTSPLNFYDLLLDKKHQRGLHLFILFLYQYFHIIFKSSCFNKEAN